MTLSRESWYRNDTHISHLHIMYSSPGFGSEPAASIQRDDDPTILTRLSPSPSLHSPKVFVVANGLVRMFLLISMNCIICYCIHHIFRSSSLSRQFVQRGGGGGSIRSCDALLKRVEENDPALTELVILPMKVFGPLDVDRLSSAIGEECSKCVKMNIRVTRDLHFVYVLMIYLPRRSCYVMVSYAVA